MKKTLAFCPIHYGIDYLQYAIQAIYPVVDEIIILYSNMPQLRTDLKCPDSEDKLKEQAFKHDPENKIKWISKKWHVETMQWDEAKVYARKHGFQVLVWFDFDEIWKTDVLERLIRETHDNPTLETLCWMRHLWRSFNWICDDVMRQNRIFSLDAPKGSLVYSNSQVNDIWHFGYARKLVDTEYKESIHLHKDEWREKWFEEKFKGWKPGIIDTHPTCVGHWNPKEFDKSELPEMMKDHLYYNLKTI